MDGIRDIDSYTDSEKERIDAFPAWIAEQSEEVQADYALMIEWVKSWTVAEYEEFLAGEKLKAKLQRNINANAETFANDLQTFSSNVQDAIDRLNSIPPLNR